MILAFAAVTVNLILVRDTLLINTQRAKVFCKYFTTAKSKSAVIFINKSSSSTLWLSGTHSALDTNGENRSWIRTYLGCRSAPDCKAEHLKMEVFVEVTICLRVNISRRSKGSSNRNLHFRSWIAWSSKWSHYRRLKRQDKV